jgi:hypothetical protein
MRWWQRLWDAVWKARQREIDRDLLWPSIREQTENIDVAKRAFRHHAARDPAYSNMSPNELDRYIEELPP